SKMASEKSSSEANSSSEKLPSICSNCPVASSTTVSSSAMVLTLASPTSVAPLCSCGPIMASIATTCGAICSPPSIFGGGISANCSAVSDNASPASSIRSTIRSCTWSTSSSSAEAMAPIDSLSDSSNGTTPSQDVVNHSAV